jgi:general secretion pathway protein G
MLLTTLRSARAKAASRGTRRAAFTLLEVLIVVAILVILASTASIAYFRYMEDAKIGRAKGDMRAIKTAIESYYIEHGTYPEPDQLMAIAPKLEQGQAGLYDPWGQPYRFTVNQEQAEDGTTKVRVYVMCQPPDQNKPEIIVPDPNTGR